MEQGLTLEQLQQMGVKQITPKPEQQPKEAGFSLEEMQRIGAKEIKPKVIPQFDVQGRKIDPVKYAKQQQVEQNITEGLGNVSTSIVGGTQEQFMGGLEKIKTSVTGGAERMQAGVEQGGVVGATKFGRAALETGLGAASGAVQTLFSPVTSAIGTGIQGWMELDRATGGKVKDSVASLVRSNPELVSKFNKMIAYDPQLTTDIVDILNVLGTKTGVKASKPMVTGAVEATVPVVKNAVDTGIQVGKDFIAQRAVNQTEKIINARAEELRNISNNYVSLKKKQIYNKDFDESIKRVAETDVLVGAVDENGLISTKGKGGAVERYKAETLDGAEQVVRTNLERLNETVNLADVEKTLTNAVNKSGLEGADLKTALNSIRQEIAGYKLRADMNGNVPLTLIQDAKISKTKGINYLTPPNVGVKDKAIANGLKRIVEDNSILNVKEINNELSKYLKDIDFLESLDGKRVKGGKLGKYFAQISGNIIGGTAGAAIGGPVGSALGTIIGGELGGKIKGTLMSKTLKGKTGTLAPKNKIIEGAVLKAKEYKKMSDDLKSFYKTYGKETGTKNSIIKLDARNKEALNDFLNSIKEVTPEAPVVNVKELKSMYDAMYESGIEKYNALVKFQEGGAKNKFSDGLPEVLGKKAPGANGRNLAANSYAQKFQKQGDYFIEELGFKDRDEANDFLESFKDIIEQRKILKNYSNKEGSLNQQYNPTNNSNSIDIQPNTTPTPPKGKGIRGMIDFDEIMKSLIPTKKLVKEAKDAVDELEATLSYVDSTKSPQAVKDLRKELGDLMTSMGRETVITNSNYRTVLQEADDMLNQLKAHIKNSEAQASNDVIERRFIKNPITGKLEGSSKKKVVSEVPKTKVISPLEQEAKKFKSAYEFSNDPMFQYHLSISPNLKEGKTFSEQMKIKNTGERGLSGGDGIYTTLNPGYWDSQLAYEGNSTVPTNVYLVKIKNPSKPSFDAPHQDLSNLNDVIVVKKLGKTKKSEVFDSGLFEHLKNKYLKEIFEKSK